MEPRIRRFALCCLLMGGYSMVEAGEVTACIVDDAIPNNPVYYYLPTTGSKLRCEMDDPDYHPTLQDLYADGWRLVEIVDPKVKLKPGANTRPSPVLYMERSGPGPIGSGPATTEKPPAEEKKGVGIFGF